MRKKQAPSSKSEKLYTFSVSISFVMQYTFTHKEVQPAEEGREGDMEPSDKALAKLERDVQDHLGLNYPVDGVQAWADFDSLLGVDEAPTVITATRPSGIKSPRREKGKSPRRKP